MTETRRFLKRGGKAARISLACAAGLDGDLPGWVPHDSCLV